MRRLRVGLVLVPLLAGGCVSLQEFFDPDAARPASAVVPSSPFGTPAPTPSAATRLTSYNPGSADVALRVDRIGHDLVRANPQARLDPNLCFATYGAPQPEIFHQGTKMVHITEPLVRGCKGDGELAAVLALELAKMVAERQAKVPPRALVPDERPPMDVPIGNPGQAGAVDQAHLVELARYEKRRARAREAAAALDPQALAAGYLENAGYARTELEAVRPLLQAAEANYVLEKHVKTAGSGWTSPSR